MPHGTPKGNSLVKIILDEKGKNTQCFKYMVV